MKAIITDLDRTLLRADKSVSEYTVITLKKCRGNGVLVMAASARPWRAIQAYNELIGFDAVTTLNGAVVMLPHDELSFGISAQSGERIILDLMSFQGVFISVETSVGLFSNREYPLWNPIVYAGFPKLPDNAVLYKILASGNVQMLRSVERILTADVYHTIAENELVQIMSVDAIKWNGVKHMLSRFGGSPGDAVYFGDDNDDVEPIKRCGLGVAVANAIPQALAAADNIADGNDADGVARFIDKHIL